MCRLYNRHSGSCERRGGCLRYWVRMLRSVLPLALLPFLAACSANLVAQETADADTSAVAAMVVVEQSTGPGEASHTESVARFLRTHGGIDDTARAMVGADLDVPALGTCKAIAVGEGSAPARPLELLDVGALTLDGTGSHASLVARRVPDVVDLVSGVVYTTREAPAFGGKVTLHAAGSQDLEGFTVTADAPSAIEQLRINGADASASLLVISASAPHAELSWVAGADTVYVDLAAGKSPASTRCAFKDDGFATLALPADVTTLTVHRVRQLPLHARGVDEGTLRFDTSRVIAFARR